MTKPDDLLRLAADIRAVDGNHDLGAGELAELLIERGWRSQSIAGRTLSVVRYTKHGWYTVSTYIPGGRDWQFRHHVALERVLRLTPLGAVRQWLYLHWPIEPRALSQQSEKPNL